ncbi:MAG TPA: Gfo/Idh/MocA family oxidoreductase [Nitrososphaerales archaeon]|nr:Gfo/Idh/MocA family oxidoreductase [Nitrososphaerales archaeon]
MKSERVGVGVIGVGSIGKTHASNLATRVPGAKLVAVSDVNQAAASEASSRFGVKAFGDYTELLEDESVEAVVIATPPLMKKEITVRAADRRKAVFCEKPIAVSMESADAMVEAVKSSGITFQVGYQKRFDQSFVAAKQAIDGGEVGRILLVRANNRDPPSRVGGWTADPRKSGSIFLDTCSHDFDAVRWLTGSEVERVYADGSSTMFEELKASGDYDTVTITLKLRNGTMAEVDACTYTPYGFDSRAEIVGTKAGVFIDMGAKDQMRMFRKDSVSFGMHDFYGSRWGQAYLDEMIGFVDAVSNSAVPRATVRDGRAAVRIGLAAWDSIKSGAPVRLVD